MGGCLGYQPGVFRGLDRGCLEGAKLNVSWGPSLGCLGLPD